MRQRLQEQSQLTVDEAPDDEAVRQTYNFAPGYHGLVYRADGPDYGGSYATGEPVDHEESENGKTKESNTASTVQAEKHGETKYKLQSMKWGNYCPHMAV